LGFGETEGGVVMLFSGLKMENKKGGNTEKKRHKRENTEK
jgi:hypothetical protein